MACRLAVVTTHPVQYYAPLFRRIAEHESIILNVFYGWTGSTEASYDPGFGQEVEWDLPLLEGYDHTFVPNEADEPGTHHFRGMINPSLPDEMERWGADAVLVFGWGWQSHLQILRHFAGTIPVLFRGDSTLIDERKGLRRWIRRLGLWWVYRYVDRALYVGQHNRAYFRAHGLSEGQLTWVPHAIENARFAEAPDADDEARRWRREIGIPDDALVVLFAGKLGAKKAPDVLVDAFLGLKREAHCVIVGSGPMEDELRTCAGDHPRAHFLGFQNQSRMPVVYRLGDVFVLPSRGPGETWGLAVNEAMACGCPVVVSSNVGCAPNLVDEKNGAVVAPDDADALREALEELLSDPGRLRRMGQRSAERIQNWSVDEAAARTVKAVNSTMALKS
ncbi:glycosyltransferase family 4 protein [Salinibacter grassmerensis]|uniref:glycosyltransferase family 4 protein n=1 Tax=Salinibacter grassmerensis TaxID=3040353 RepID=UPI0021E7CA61|nr:glycosyltransferase family 4 protein [Salinibacter grassmerensis]